MARIDAARAGGIDRLAFLDMIAWSEIGPDLLAVSDDGYNVLEGSTASHPLLFTSYAAHPHHLNVKDNSTAAGRPQITWPTWHGLQQSIHLPDFSPISQEIAALELARRRGAWAALDAGDIHTAITLCNQEWASLPGAGATLPNGKPQHENRFDGLIAAYSRALAKYTGKPA